MSTYDDKTTKPIPGFPGYEVTKDGRVFSNSRFSWNGKRIKERWLSLYIDSYGRPMVTLYKKGTGYVKRVCLLVLEIWERPRIGDEQCRHLDGNPANNRLENLCWGTKSENERDKIRHGTSNRGERHGMSKIKESDVHIILYLRRKAKFTYKQIAFHFDISWGAVRAVCLGYRWGHISL